MKVRCITFPKACNLVAISTLDLQPWSALMIISTKESLVYHIMQDITLDALSNYVNRLNSKTYFMVRLAINLVENNNYVNERLDKLHQVIRILGKTLNSTSFEIAVKKHMVDGKRTFFYRKNFLGRRYLEHPYSNEDVYDIIMSGVERLGGSTANSMDLYLTLKNGSNGNVIGYGNPSHKEIFTYSTMFDSMDVSELANHYTHEWCHKLGFAHSFQRNRHRSYSVPYAVGDIVEEIAETLIGKHDVLLEGTEHDISIGPNHSGITIEKNNSIVENDFQFKTSKIRTWRTAESLKTLLKQVNTLAPDRNKTSDGTIGDSRHRTGDSDHNPWVIDESNDQGIVTALDITHSPGNCDCDVLANSLQMNKDLRIKYVIWNKQIMSSSPISGNLPWTWRNYNGKNPHDHHIHISVKSEKNIYDEKHDWNINIQIVGV
jgi:hypothetical protein